MTGLVMTSPLLVAGQTLVISQMYPLSNLAKVAARVGAVAVEVILVPAGEVLGGKRCQISLAHDLLADVINAMTCNSFSNFVRLREKSLDQVGRMDIRMKEVYAS